VKFTYTLLIIVVRFRDKILMLHKSMLCGVVSPSSKAIQLFDPDCSMVHQINVNIYYTAMHFPGTFQRRLGSK